MAQRITLLIKSFTAIVKFSVSLTDTIASLKESVQKSMNVGIAQQRLIFNRRELENSETLGSVGVEENAVIFLVLALRGIQKVVIRTLDDREFIIEAAADDTIHRIKERIQTKTTSPTERQRLIANGKELMDHEKLSDHFTEQPATGHIVLHLLVKQILPTRGGVTGATAAGIVKIEPQDMLFQQQQQQMTPTPTPLYNNNNINATLVSAKVSNNNENQEAPPTTKGRAAKMAKTVGDVNKSVQQYQQQMQKEQLQQLQSLEQQSNNNNNSISEWYDSSSFVNGGAGGVDGVDAVVGAPPNMMRLPSQDEELFGQMISRSRSEEYLGDGLLGAGLRMEREWSCNRDTVMTDVAMVEDDPSSIALDRSISSSSSILTASTTVAASANNNNSSSIVPSSASSLPIKIEEVECDVNSFWQQSQYVQSPTVQEHQQQQQQQQFQTIASPSPVPAVACDTPLSEQQQQKQASRAVDLLPVGVPIALPEIASVSEFALAAAGAHYSSSAASSPSQQQQQRGRMTAASAAAAASMTSTLASAAAAAAAAAPGRRVRQDLTPEEKLQKRLVKNRQSAERSRQRKQAYTEDLEYRLSLSKSENAHLRNRVHELECSLAALSLLAKPSSMFDPSFPALASSLQSLPLSSVAH